MKRDTKKAFKWIVGILKSKNITFQITGGFVAKVYGAKRPLQDIDIEIYEKDFSKITPLVKDFIVKGPYRYQDKTYDLLLLTLSYEGQDIDISGVKTGKMFDRLAKKWESCDGDLSDIEKHKVYGTVVPVVEKEDLIDYKNKIRREVDLEDVKALKKKMKKNTPKIKFTADARQDILNYILFTKYSDKKFFKMFLPKELHYILSDKSSKVQKEKIIKEYVLNNFKEHKEEIKINIREINRQWKKVEKDYFELMDRVFKNHPWPKGKYIGFASVFKMFPRYVEDKTFYFSGFREDVKSSLKTVAHEMTHFIFFDYIKEKYNITQSTNFPYVWNVSEVFNLVMEKWKPYVKIFHTKGIPYDKAHARMLPKMKKIWDKSEDIDVLLNKYFKKYV